MENHRVHIEKCGDYDYAAVKKAVREAVEAVGGMAVKSGDQVILKPNLLTTKNPEKAVTTHPAVVSAAAEMVLDCGGKVTVGDSPSGSPGDSIWKATALDEVIKRLGLQQSNFTNSGTVEDVIRGNSYFFAQPALECDLLINLPKLKTHALTMYTGAVKNLYGCLPGFQKGNWHRRAPRNEQFSQVVVDVFSKFQPRLNIMDGITAMEGDGPSNGKPKHLGVIVAADNAPALDRIAAQIIGFEADEILTTRYAELRGFTGSSESILLTGSGIDEVRPDSFVLPKDRYLRMIPELAHEILGKFIWTRPEVNPELCIECGDCAGNCPVEAMELNGAPPDIDYKLCIKCYCCDEICPEGAIGKKMSWLARKLS